ncbi:T9SS type A sorting domain-containing protein [Hymenobacter ruricola]|uniref:T9SS type A sorting domain-containing protein n=1 Tax=Hymenobacter ruricola TaxID=2791023 RepID=A0ABS0I3C4_9BACT|nr:LamG-like jellyroll fold domain-containing protein [Hymenobacter ruricola]MBF9221456.1 T9SS type A sorting domain-containing protein [Hymenobacter ruricola]
MKHFSSSSGWGAQLLSALTKLRLLALLPLLALATSCATVTTDTPSNITFNSARLGGTATAGSGSYVLERGVVYSTTSATPDLNTGSTLVPMAGAGDGPFSQVVTGLRPNQLYYVRAYATASNTQTSGSGVYIYGPAVQFTTADGPYLGSLSPGNGPVGTSVTLTGSGLTGATGVSFNGTAATTFAVVNATTVTATVPTGATSGDVTVTTPLGTSNGIAFVVGAATNNALAFDGLDDFVALGSPASLSNLGLSGGTFEAWVNVGSTSRTNSVIRKDGDYSLTIFSGQPYIEVWPQGVGNSAHTYMYGTTNLTAGRWHHLAATWDGTSLRLYLDGVDVSGTQNAGPATANSQLQLGRSATYGQVLNGRLDEVRIYNTPLTLAQVQADMLSASGAAAVPASQKYYANFDQGVAGGTNTGLTSLSDQSGNGTTGTLTNFALTGTASNWVRSFATITGITPASGPVGTAVTITGTNLTDATGFAFNGTGTTGFTTPASDLTATVAVPTGAGTGPASLSAATLPRYNGPVFTVTATTAVTWTGAVSTDWATAGNWSPAVVPTTGLDVTIPAAPANQPVVSGAQGSRNLTVAAGARLTLAANATLGVGSLGSGTTSNLLLGSGSTFTQGPGSEIYLTGNLTNNGATFALNATSEIGFGLSVGTVHLLNGTAGVTFQTLTVGEQGSFDNLTMQVPVQVRRKLGVYNNSTTSQGTGGSLTLLSDATGTALVENGANSTVGGTVTVQRYIDPSQNPNRGYRHVSSPVSNATVASLATAGFAPVVNPQYNTVGNTVAQFPTVFGYDQTRLATAATPASAFDKGWYSPGALTDPLAVGKGYTVNLAANQTWNFTGALTNGDVSQTLARNAGATANDAGLHLVGNPYPSPLDWTLVDATDRPNVDGTIYAFVSDDPSNPYSGTYRFFAGTFGNLSPVLPVGRGFFVRVTQGQTSGTLTFKNSHRVTTYSAFAPVFQRPADARPAAHLTLRAAAGSAPADDAFVYFDGAATDGFDAAYDAEKLANPSGLNLSSSLSAAQRLCVNGLAPLTATQRVVPLAVGVPAAGSYTLAAAELRNLSTTPVYLRDLQTGAVVDLAQQPSYSFTVSNAAALITGRFELVFSPQAVLATAPAALAAQVGLYPNPASTAVTVELPATLGRTAVAAELVDALGRVARTLTLPAQGATAHRLDLAELATGVYTLHLRTSAGVIVKKLVVQ